MTRNLLKAALAVGVAASALIGVAVAPANALYNDQSRKFPPRTCAQQVTYERFTLNYNDPNISTGQQFAAIPANAYILSIDAHVTTAFNAATTNVVTIGATQANANEIVASGTITPGTASVQHLTAAAGLGLVVTGNTTYQAASSGVVAPYVPLYAKYTQTGTAATAGSVTVVVSFVCPDDQ